jgi:RNA polymerase sigma-70 factor (ECF subfamily)
LENWLIRVVASACRHLGRGQKRDAALHDSEAELAARDDPERDVAAHELGRILEEALLALPAKDRSILLLAELDELSAAEIGAELAMSAGAVRTRLSRLRKGMAEVVGQRLLEK